MKAEPLPDAIRNALEQLSPDVPLRSKIRAARFLRTVPVELAGLVVFEDDGDLVVHWVWRGIYCEFLKSSTTDRVYRVNKVA